MRHQSKFAALIILAFGCVWTVYGQTKITTVSSMRARQAPQTTAPEIARLKLGTVVNATARSSAQDTIGGKTDYWYQVSLANGQSGWLFGGLLLDYNASQREQILRQIVETRLKAESTDFADRQEIYNLAALALTEAKNVNTRAEFELLKLQALANSAAAFPDGQRTRSPYREWLVAHKAEIIPNEFAGSYNVRTDLFWRLEAKYHALPISDRIAWAAVENEQPHDCEGDEVCHLFVFEDAVKYLNLHPSGAYAAEAVKNLNELITDDVIKRANDKDGDRYVVEERTSLRRLLAQLRLALAKTSVAGKSELLKRLDRVNLPR